MVEAGGGFRGGGGRGVGVGVGAWVGVIGVVGQFFEKFLKFFVDHFFRCRPI